MRQSPIPRDTLLIADADTEIKMKLIQFRIYFNVAGQVHTVNKKELLQNVDI